MHRSLGLSACNTGTEIIGKMQNPPTQCGVKIFHGKIIMHNSCIINVKAFSVETVTENAVEKLNLCVVRKMYLKGIS